MTATNDFFVWFYYGLDGLGGWLIFLLFAMAAVIWLLYDSGTRRLPALGWKMAVILTAALILPSIIYRFTTDPLNPFLSPLAPFAEPIFYIGVLGGLLPIVLAVGYYVTFQGLVGCPRGIHGAYDVILGECPDCAAMAQPPIIIKEQGDGGRRPEKRQNETPAPPVNKKRKMQAWLVGSNKTFQLNERETTIGRHSSNDIYLTDDTTVSRQHAKIVEQGGHFKLHDLGAKGLTRVNGRTVRGPVLLESDDEIRFGDNTSLRFKK